MRTAKICSIFCLLMLSHGQQEHPGSELVNISQWWVGGCLLLVGWLGARRNKQPAISH
jgi:hypothetical protein